MKPGTGFQKFLPEHMRIYAEVHFALMASLPEDAATGTRMLLATVAAFEGRFIDTESSPSVHTLGRFAGMSSPRTVEKHLDILHELERVATIPNYGRTSTYATNFPQKPSLMRRGCAKSAASAEPAHDQRVPEEEGREEEKESKAAASVCAGEGAPHVDDDRLFEELAAAAVRIEGEPEARPSAPPPASNFQREDGPLESPARTRDAREGTKVRASQPRAHAPKRPPATTRPLDLRDCRSPLLSPELVVALRVLPGARSALRMLERRAIPKPKAEFAVKRALKFHRSQVRRGLPGVGDASAFLCHVMPDFDELEFDQVEQQERLEHDYVPPTERPDTPKRPRKEPEVLPDARKDFRHTKVGAAIAAKMAAMVGLPVAQTA
jgi:hypothetical protein